MIKLDKLVYGGEEERGDEQGSIVQDSVTGLYYLLVEQDEEGLTEERETWVAVKFKEREETIVLENVKIVVEGMDRAGDVTVIGEMYSCTEEYAEDILQTIIEYLIEREEKAGIDLECGEDFIMYVARNLTEDSLEYYFSTEASDEGGALKYTDTILGVTTELSYEILAGVYAGVYMDNISLEIEGLGTGEVVVGDKITLDNRMLDVEDEEEERYVLEGYMGSLHEADVVELLLEGIL